MKQLTQTDRFSFARLLAVFANDLITQRKTIITSLGIGFSMFFIVETLSTHNYIEEGLQFAEVANNLKNLFPFTFVMISTMMASLMLSDCRRKEKRLAVIMLPALSSEKYLSRIMLVLSGIVAGLVIHTVVYYLLVALHFIFQNSAGFMKGAALRSDIFSPIGFADVTINGNKIDTHVLSNLVTGALMSMWLTSCYILGGTIWKKGSWLITSAILLALSFVTTGMLKDSHTVVFTLKANTFFENFLISAIVWLLLTAVNICLSYLIFKRMQVTHKKLSDFLGRRRRT